MTIHVAICHKTEYRYDRRVSLSPHVFRLRPAPHCRTPIEAYSLKITPGDHFINWQQDPFGNYLARVVFNEKTDRMLIDVDLVARMTVINPFDFFHESYAQHFPFDYPAQLKKELWPYLQVEENGPGLKAWMRGIARSRERMNDFLVGLNRKLWEAIAYTVRLEPGIQTCEETLTKASGSCRDSAWLLVQILRHLGLAARFVSGYLVQLVADEKSLDGPSGPEADFTDLHAWAEVYIPGAGWLGLDPTSGLFAGEGHIPLACTPDPVSAAPVTGATDKCETTFSYTNHVARVAEEPRVTKPYTQDQWQAIDALGEQVEAALVAGDVRLSMGGEPTFVSIDDMESAQWNTTALGAHKRALAENLWQRLHAVFAPGGLRHASQGKWYPGEELPRWALASYWRRDGRPIWRNPSLLAANNTPRGADLDLALNFIQVLSRRLGLDPSWVTPGYEDPLYHLWAESRLPVNVDPLEADLKDTQERQRLAERLRGDLGAPAGYALPLKWDFGIDGWTGARWTFRTPRMYLTPGTSPMGLRLPLESLPWVAKDEREPWPEPSPLEALPPLGEYGQAMLAADPVDEPSQAPRPTSANVRATPKPPREIPHTALCVEPRDGHLHVFMPPASHLEHYLELVTRVEDTAAELGHPVILEGYPPPADPRLHHFRVTPDPGVIEVNIHPAASWRELVTNTVTLYEEARLARLGTEKFMLDGRHTGTGGGNHVTLGGVTPADSPMLRRPDLLRSLITFWQHHPGLSYLFAGTFIGPTSQAPRVDEGRDEQLYELEIAFDQIPPAEAQAPYWLVDRLLRHLLVDITGNTHRAEFCIDKLYSPDSLAGRQGLVEFRAFDMPPHARMSIVQMLLLRTLIAIFWNQPYRQPLVRWGTELHDRWMLPHYVEADLGEVAAMIQAAGFPFAVEWLAPFFAFRFPHYGTVQIKDIAIELRMAIEPWHVLGEELSSVGTSRFVDSSLERLQIRCLGLTDGRYALACNGRRIPLRATGTQGEYVAGVRYRAWQPPSALHPTIGVHSPLVFDLIDTWTGRSVGGCTYHVSHPGGRHYEVFPVNAFEAEARRTARFWGFGHTPGSTAPPPPPPFSQGRFEPQGHPPGPMSTPALEANPEYPYTLDLRFTPKRFKKAP
ncbi:MAG: transglutaminase family protein [Desulfobacterales bacterium]|nr:transglutaminase family protein [Desulfobacterales bacterium]MDJ0990261.1 transglutaminase family protein [Desulfobacterales bacterium]